MRKTFRLYAKSTIAAFVALLCGAATAQYTVTVPVPGYYRNPPVIYPNRAAILGQALENTYDTRQQYQDASRYAADQRQLYLADQQNRARYLQQQNDARLQYQQQLQIQQQQQQFQQQYGHANSTPSYAVPQAPISPSQQNQYVQQWNNQHQSRQATVNQRGQAPLPPPGYEQARRLCTNGQATWYC